MSELRLSLFFLSIIVILKLAADMKTVHGHTIEVSSAIVMMSPAAPLCVLCAFSVILRNCLFAPPPHTHTFFLVLFEVVVTFVLTKVRKSILNSAKTIRSNSEALYKKNVC